MWLPLDIPNRLSWLERSNCSIGLVVSLSGSSVPKRNIIGGHYHATLGTLGIADSWAGIRLMWCTVALSAPGAVVEGLVLRSGGRHQGGRGRAGHSRVGRLRQLRAAGGRGGRGRRVRVGAGQGRGRRGRGRGQLLPIKLGNRLPLLLALAGRLEGGGGGWGEG